MWTLAIAPGESKEVNRITCIHDTQAGATVKYCAVLEQAIVSGVARALLQNNITKLAQKKRRQTSLFIWI